MSENTLTKKDAAQYARCNKIIKKNKQAFKACGLALSTVLTQKLYRFEYDTFELYCLKKHGFKKSQAYRLMEAAQTVETSPAGDKIETERQARALKDIPAEKHEEVIATAKANGKVTAPALEEAAKKVVPIEVIDVDKVGHAIPTPAMPTWARKDEVNEYLQILSKIRVWAEKMQKTGDKFYAEVNFQELYTDCNNAYANLKDAVPYSVCAACQGQAPKTCKLCNGRGMISKFSWDHHVPKQQKDMMQKKAEHDAPQKLSATGG
jgi:hypothetical protein